MPISVMLKPSSSNCNLKCDYCFYHSLSAGRKEPSKGFMGEAVAEAVIKNALDYAGGSDVFFTFQGGEPSLIGLPFYQRFVELVGRWNTRGSKVVYCFQTNGTLIDEAWCSFWKAHQFLIGVSLDGDEALNRYRVYPDGRNSFQDILQGIKLLEQYQVPFNILSVVTKDVARNIRASYRFFRSNGWRYLQYIPCLAPLEGGREAPFYMDNEDYAYFLNKAFRLYFNELTNGKQVSVRQFDNYVYLNAGRGAEQCGMNGICSSQFVVEADGSTYPCDFYCTDEWLLGNIQRRSFREMGSGEKAAAFLKESHQMKEECGNCRYFSLCRGGGCKRNRQDQDYCAAYRSFFGENEEQLKALTKFIK